MTFFNISGFLVSQLIEDLDSADLGKDQVQHDDGVTAAVISIHLEQGLFAIVRKVDIEART